MRTRSILRHADTYCKSSTIHGISYLTTREGISWFEHILWALALTISLCFCLLFLLTMNADWDSNPVVTTIDTTYYPIQNISFPAITVCAPGYDIWAFLQRYIQYFILFKTSSFRKNTVLIIKIIANNVAVYQN
jgi:hypothetical protein